MNFILALLAIIVSLTLGVQALPVVVKNSDPGNALEAEQKGGSVMRARTFSGFLPQPFIATPVTIPPIFKRSAHIVNSKETKRSIASEPSAMASTTTDKRSTDSTLDATIIKRQLVTPFFPKKPVESGVLAKEPVTS